MNRKNFRLAVVFSLIIFISVGICVSVLSSRWGCRIDITEDRLYTLSEESEAMLAALGQPVTLTVFDLRTDFPAIVANLLDSYDCASEKITVEYCDPYHEPQKIRQLNSRGLDVSQSDIAVQCGGNSKLLSVNELFQLDDSKNYVTRLMAEQQISSAIASVSKTEKGSVLFTDGHGETPSASLMALFGNNQYRTSFAELSVLGIPEDARLIVICAPRKDATPQEIELLSSFMERGGAVLCFMAPGSAELSRFGEFLAERGIGLTDDALREPSLSIAGNELNIAASYANHEINTYFARNRRYVVSPSTSAVEQLYVKQGRTKTEPVLRSSPDSYTALGECGSAALCVSSQRISTDSSGKECEQNLIVFGSGLICGDDLLGEEKLANGDFLLQTLTWLVGDEELMNVPVKDLTADILPATRHLTRVYIAVFTVAVPLAILVIGLFVYIRRRVL